MPFLHPSKKSEPWFKWAEKQSYRNGWRCKIFRPEGGYYKGNFKKNLKSGKGVQLLASGLQYEGDWCCDKRDGFGVLSRYDPSEKLFHLVYMGDYKNNKKQGYGSFHYEDGTFYEGELKKDKRHGFGKCWFPDGSYYEGHWVKDLRDGCGLFVQANGNRYEGEWHHDKKNGIGEFYHLATAQRQVGYWENEVCVTSKMEDIRFRQSAVFPTCYPIPQLKLKAEVPCSVFLESVHKIINERNEHCQIQEH